MILDTIRPSVPGRKPLMLEWLEPIPYTTGMTDRALSHDFHEEMRARIGWRIDDLRLSQAGKLRSGDIDLEALLIDLAGYAGANGRLDAVEAVQYLYDELSLKADYESELDKAEEMVTQKADEVAAVSAELSAARDAAEYLPDITSAVERVSLDPLFRLDLINTLEEMVHELRTRPGSVVPEARATAAIEILRRTTARKVIELSES